MNEARILEHTAVALSRARRVPRNMGRLDGAAGVVELKMFGGWGVAHGCALDAWVRRGCRRRAEPAAEVGDEAVAAEPPSDAPADAAVTPAVSATVG
jgi:hypothetical protein